MKINAAKVRELFERNRLTDKDAAKLTHLSLDTIKRIQVDDARTTRYVIFALMMAFNVTREELVVT